MSHYPPFPVHQQVTGPLQTDSQPGCVDSKLPKAPRSSRWLVHGAIAFLQCTACAFYCGQPSSVHTIEIVQKHYRVVHQARVSCHFKSSRKQPTLVMRTPRLGFVCSNCAMVYQDPHDLKKHTLQCGLSLYSSPTGPEAFSRAAESPSTDSTATCVPPDSLLAVIHPEAKTPSGSLRSPNTNSVYTPRNLRKLTTRAQRALVRHLHNAEGRTFLEIADYLNMGPTVVECVVSNEIDDDIESDINYTCDLTVSEDNTRGLEGLELMYPDEKERMDLDATSSGNAVHEDDDMDDAEVEQLLCLGHQSCAEDEDVSDMFQVLQENRRESSYITGGSISYREASPALRHAVESFLKNLGADLSHLVEPMTTFGCTTECELDVLCSLSWEVEWASTLQGWLELQLSETPYMSRLPSDWDILEQGLLIRRHYHPAHPPSEFLLASSASVFEFLRALRQPLGHRLMLFFKQNISTLQHLHELCLADEAELNNVGVSLMEAGLTPLEWLIVCEGLGMRATSLRSE